MFAVLAQSDSFTPTAYCLDRTRVRRSLRIGGWTNQFLTDANADASDRTYSQCKHFLDSGKYRFMKVTRPENTSRHQRIAAGERELSHLTAVPFRCVIVQFRNVSVPKITALSSGPIGK